MIHDDIMALEGRELDVAVAERIEGKKVVNVEPVTGETGYWTEREDHWTRVSGKNYPLLDMLDDYSSNLGYAWYLAEDFADGNGVVVGTRFDLYGQHSGYYAEVFGERAESDNDPAEALCRAMLILKMKMETSS